MGAPGVAVAPCPAGIVCIPAKISSRYGSSSSHAIRCSEGSSGFASSPKTGAVGGQRLENALPGTYWGKDNGVGNEIQVIFNKGSDVVMTKARVGENLLRVAERCGVMLPTPEFCFEGSCCHCEMEVIGGASEIGPSGNGTIDELVRSCICPIPFKQDCVDVNMINEDDVWGERVV